MNHSATSSQPHTRSMSWVKPPHVPTSLLPLPLCSVQRPKGPRPLRICTPSPTAILAAGSVGTSPRRDVSDVNPPVASSATGLNQALYQSTPVWSPSQLLQRSPRPIWANDPESPAAQAHPMLQNPPGRTSPMSSAVAPEPRNYVPNWGASHG